MGFLDFVNKRGKDKQQDTVKQTQEQRPETARQMHLRQASQEKVNQKPVEQIPQADKEKAREIRQRIDRATQHLHTDAASRQPAPADASSSPEPMRQRMTAQDKTAPALSPTSGQAGKTAEEKDARAPHHQPATKTQEKPGQRPQQTLPRRPPSWER